MVAIKQCCVVFLSILSCLCAFSLPRFCSKSILRRGSAHVKNTALQSRTFMRLAVVGDVVDVSPNKDGSLVKTLLREGDYKRSRPIIGDRIEVVYKMFDQSTGELLHDSAQGPKVSRLENGIYPVNYTANGTFVEGGVLVIKNARSYNFDMGAGRVLKGWEIAIKTMRLGEISSFVMQPEYTFGSKGAPPLVQPNAVLRFIFELVRLRPPWQLDYESMNEGDSVKDNLAQQIMSGESAFGEAIMRKRKQAAPATDNESLTRNSKGPSVVHREIVPDGPLPSTGSSKRSHTQNNNPKSVQSPSLSQTPQTARTGTESNAERTFFDPARHALDTTTEVDGEAEGHYRWIETMNSMDIELPLRVSEGEYVRKADLVVDIRASTVDVRFANGTVLLAGPLQGKINPHEVTWALNDYTIQQQYKNHASQYLQVSLEKTALYRDIWGTVLSRDYLTSLLTPEERTRREAELANAHAKATQSSQFSQPVPPRAAPIERSSVPALRSAASVSASHDKADEEEEEEEVSYVDFDMDEEGRVIGTSTGTGRREQA